MNRRSSGSLKTIATAEADFRSNDRDNDGAENYWVRDVYGLFALCPRGETVDASHMIKLVEPSLASADAGRPQGYAGLVAPVDAIGSYSPRAGYVYAMIPRDADGRPYDDGTGHGVHFAVCSYPVSPSAGQHTFIMDDTITIWRKRVDGPVQQWPRDLRAEGWERVD